ncbi:FecR domain-containing protein [Flammeovirgaceae bacterium SG7u.111]|nr:FecR domain-containing protein [Flammeovirgaceae bacterium SG7u.132]WPO37943.1 FecR domain-containing protein [Flammeovirgaceae bacterium SG7u.111]
MKNWEDIFSYLNGELSDAEVSELDQWRKVSPENESYFQKVNKVYESTPRKDLAAFSPDVDQAWGKFNHAIQQEKTSKTGLSVYFNNWYKVAAMLSLILLGTWAISMLLSDGMTSITVAEGAGSQKVELEDGTEIWLREGASLTYPTHFDEEKRWVKLEGEAFFDVEKDPSKPFVVEAQATQTKVLGTSFNLNSESVTGNVEIALFTGKVEFVTEKESLTLAPGEKIAFGASTGKLEKAAIQSPNITAWKTKKLQFVDTPFLEVIHTLERYYNIEIEVLNKEILNCGFTSDFQDISLEEILKILEATEIVTVKRISGKVVLDGNGCTEETPL